MPPEKHCDKCGGQYKGKQNSFAQTTFISQQERHTYKHMLQRPETGPGKVLSVRRAFGFQTAVLVAPVFKILSARCRSIALLLPR